MLDFHIYHGEYFKDYRSIGETNVKLQDEFKDI